MICKKNRIYQDWLETKTENPISLVNTEKIR